MAKTETKKSEKTEQVTEEVTEEVTPVISENLQFQANTALGYMVPQFENLEMGLIDMGDPDQGTVTIDQFAARARDDLATLAEAYFRWLEHEFEEHKANVRRAKRAQSQIDKQLASDMWSDEHKKALRAEKKRNADALSQSPAAFSDMKVLLRVLKVLRPS